MENVSVVERKFAKQLMEAFHRIQKLEGEISFLRQEIRKLLDPSP